MFCKKCGKQVMDGAAFCTYCGARIMPVNQSDSEAANQFQKKSSALPIIIAAACIVMIAGVVFGVFYFRNHVTDDEVIAKNEMQDDFDDEDVVQKSSVGSSEKDLEEDLSDLKEDLAKDEESFFKMGESLFEDDEEVFDVAGYITAILENSYKNDSSKFVSMKVGTAEEASETYEATLAQEVNTLMDLSDASNPTDEQYKQLKNIVVDIYGKAKYTVGEAEKQDDGSFVVPVTCEQIQVFGPAMEAYLTDLQTKADAYIATGGMPSDDELNNMMIETYLRSFSNAAANAVYANATTVLVRVELKDDLWQPNEDDVLSLETSLFDIEALIEAMQQLY